VLRVARVMRAPAGDYQLDPRFVPPLIDIQASDYLMAMARRLVEILAAKSSTLAGTRRQKNQSLAEFGVADTGSFWLLYTVNTYFPQFRHLFETRRGHPSDLYEAMLSLAGALTTFSTTIQPRHLPPYDHENLSRCFTELDERLRELLETVVPANFVSLPLRLVRPTVHATALDQDRYLSAPHLFLAISAEGRPADVVARVPQLVKVSSADRVDVLIRQALPGLTLTFTANPPSAIPVKLNHYYFAISRAGVEWDAVLRQRNLAAYVPADFPNAELELVIVLPPR
jgi:type VI secretion system protein ImpJ